MYHKKTSYMRFRSAIKTVGRCNRYTVTHNKKKNLSCTGKNGSSNLQTGLPSIMVLWGTGTLNLPSFECDVMVSFVLLVSARVCVFSSCSRDKPTSFKAEMKHFHSRPLLRIQCILVVVQIGLCLEGIRGLIFRFSDTLMIYSLYFSQVLWLFHSGC